jgi:pimeloyl-ACP methyl ester carboxylesterase
LNENAEHLVRPACLTSVVLVAAGASSTGLTALGLKGLRQTAIPAYLIVGAGDTATPPKENAEFAAKYIPHAQLDVLPGPVGHEILRQ